MDYRTLHKWSDLKGTALVTLDDGKKVGTLDDFYFDPQTNTAPGFLVKTGLFGHKALKTNTIHAFGQDAVTTANEDALIAEKEDAQLTALPHGSDLLSYKVMSQSGTVIGTINNLLLDLNTPATVSVGAFEMKGDLLERISHRQPTFEASKVTRYGEDVVVVPDALAVELSQ